MAARRQSAVQPCAVVTETQANAGGGGADSASSSAQERRRADVGEKRTTHWISEKMESSGASAIHNIAQHFRKESLDEAHRAQEQSDDKVDCAER
jgi:hypothetical protein